MNLPKFPHTAMFLGLIFIVILCPTILDNKTYLSRKWILDDKNVFILCDVEGKLNEWIKVQMKCFFLLPNFKEQQKSGRTPFTVS